MLVDSIRADGMDVFRVFDGTSAQSRLRSWEQLLDVAHHGAASEVRFRSVVDLPGGVWTWVQHLSVLASLGLSVKSLEEPWLVIDDGQAALLTFLKQAHDQQRRDRIRESLRTARGKVGRPRVSVDVEAMSAFRREHSLRETARQFDIGASTCHRILAAHQEVQRGSK